MNVLMQGKDMYNDDTGNYDQYVLINDKLVSNFSTCKLLESMTSFSIANVARTQQHQDTH